MVMRPLWKVTTSFQSPLGAVIGIDPLVSVFVYRRKWRARLKAYFSRASTQFGRQTATVEAYWPDSNVVPLRKAA